jgi:hypothetical protein
MTHPSSNQAFRYGASHREIVSDTAVITIGITGFSVIFTVMVALIGLLWRAGTQWGILTTEVKHLAESIGQIAIDTNERLQWLERRTGRDRLR